MQECRAELEKLQTTLATVQQKIIHAILPRDEDDYSSDAILEIRAGTGGEEAALFTGELLTAYHAAAKHQGWKFEYLNSTKTDLGGIKEAAVSITSNKSSSSYANYDNNKRMIMTTMIFLLDWDPLDTFDLKVVFIVSNEYPSMIPKFKPVLVRLPSCHLLLTMTMMKLALYLPTSDLKIETMRASGAGGQHVNTTESAVRITHLPTGITAAIQDERSQHKNKQKALKLIAARVRDALREEEARQRGDTRNSLMGGGDRSERIRTYNFPQDRVTDHRCKHSEHGIVNIVEWW